jgi:hypothetical protein
MALLCTVQVHSQQEEPLFYAKNGETYSMKLMGLGMIFSSVGGYPQQFINPILNDSIGSSHKKIKLGGMV